MVAPILLVCLAMSIQTATRQPGAGRERAAALAATADAQAMAGNLAAAIHTMEEAERAAPNWPELKVNLGALKSAVGDYAGAIAASRAALTIDPTLDGAWLNLGLAQLKSGDATAAAETLARFRGPNAPPAALAGLGLALFRLQRIEDATVALEQAVAAGLRDPESLAILGTSWLRLNDRSRAAKVAALLSAAAPGSAASRLLEGDLADADNDWVAAETAYRAALATDPDAPQAHYALGLVLYKQRRYVEAAEAFDRELAVNPQSPPALYYRAVLELDRGAPEAAVSLLQQLTTLVPGHADGWRDLGRAYLDRDQPAEAIAALQRAVTLATEDPRVHFLLGRALQRAGRAIEARAALARATELNQRVRDTLQRRVSGGRSKGQ